MSLFEKKPTAIEDNFHTIRLIICKANCDLSAKNILWRYIFLHCLKISKEKFLAGRSLFRETNSIAFCRRATVNRRHYYQLFALRIKFTQGRKKFH